MTKPDRTKNPWPARLLKLQERLGYTNQQMADKFRASIRTYLSWKYGEAIPNPQAQILIEIFLAQK